MNRARLLATAIFSLGAVAVFAQLGTIYGVTVIVAPPLAWLFIQVYYNHLDLFAAECDLSRMIREMQGGQASRERKRQERRADAGYISDSTIHAQMAPAARYHQPASGFHTQQPEIVEANRRTIGYDADGRRNCLVIDESGQVFQRPHQDYNAANGTSPTIQVIVEDAPDVSFEKPGMWLLEQNESDRKRSSRRKKSTRLNSVLFMMLYYAGPAAVKRSIVAELRTAHERNAEPPEINAHLAAIAGAPTTAKELLRAPERWENEGRAPIGVWLAMRICRHPRRRLWIKAEGGNLLRGWSALEYLETM